MVSADWFAACNAILMRSRQARAAAHGPYSARVRLTVLAFQALSNSAMISFRVYLDNFLGRSRWILKPRVVEIVPTAVPVALGADFVVDAAKWMEE